MRKRAIYAGTFDPITNGHLDIIKRASLIFDEIVVAVAKSKEKRPLFSIENRIKMVNKSILDIKNVRVIEFSSLLVDLANRLDINIVVRGLRGVNDFEYELHMGYANSSLKKELETVYLMSNSNNSFISSSLVRSLLQFKGEISHLVPKEILEDIRENYVYTT